MLPRPFILCRFRDNAPCAPASCLLLYSLLLGHMLGQFRAANDNALGIGPTLNQRNLNDDPDYDAHWASQLPAGRTGQPDDVARGLLYLVDNPYITGTTLMVDGGATI